MNGEKGIFVTHLNVRESISLLVFRLLTLDLIVVTAIALIFWLSQSTLLLSYEYSLEIIIGIVLLLHSAQLMFGFRIIMVWLTSYYEIYPEYIAVHKGIFERSTEKFFYKNIALFDVHQSWLGDMFNFGTLHLYDMNLMKDVYISYIHNPLRHYTILEELIPETNSGNKRLKLFSFRDEDKSK